MKLKKWEFLLAYVYYINQHGHVFTMSGYGGQAVDLGISKSKAGLMTMLSECKSNNLIFNDSDGCWLLTDFGEGVANALWNSFYNQLIELIDPNKTEPNFNDDNPNNDIDKMQYEIDCLHENNESLKSKLDAANAKIMNIKKQLLVAYDLLDKKTKECDRLMLGLDRMSNECKNMASWAISIKNGQG